MSGVVKFEPGRLFGEFVFGEEEGEPTGGTTPTVEATELGEQLYDTLEPTWTEPDEAEGFPLLQYCDVLLATAQPLRDQVKEVGNRPAYGVLMDVDNCPANALEYLSQFAGVDLSKLRRAIIALDRNWAVNPSFEYDNAKQLPYGWIPSQNAFAATERVFEVLEGWHAGSGTKALRIKAKHEPGNNLERYGPLQALGSPYYTPIQPGQWMQVQAQLNILLSPNQGFALAVQWFRADGQTSVGFSQVPNMLLGQVGEQQVVASVLAPEHAAFGRVEIIAVSNLSEQKVDFWIDDIMINVSPLDPTEAAVYVDGDQPNASWLGAAGRSSSIRTELQNEEQFNELKRNRIKELPASGRGTLDSIIKGAQQYLIGDRTVVVQERAAGKAWRIRIVTFLEETIDAALVKHAIEEFLPAGIVLEYEAVASATYFLIATEYSTYGKPTGGGVNTLEENFLTYQGLSIDQPGT